MLPKRKKIASTVNQRKEDYLTSLSRLKEKAILSNFPLDMKNDMITMPSNWQKRLRRQKSDKKDNPQIWTTSFTPLANSIKIKKCK